MAEQQEQEVQTVERPHNCVSERVGPGSPKGKRWFVSYSAQHQIVMRAHGGYDDNTGLPLNRKGKTLAFLSRMKPRQLWGTGENSTRSMPNSGDRNLGILWGIYETSNQAEIDFLRTRETYEKTTQDNELNDPRPLLKEYDFDPTPKPDAQGGARTVERRTSTAEPKEQAPEGEPSDAHQDPASVKPGLPSPRGKMRKF